MNAGHGDMRDRLLELRRRMQISQGSLARMLGVHKTSVRLWDARKRARVGKSEYQRRRLRRRVAEIERFLDNLDMRDRTRPINFHDGVRPWKRHGLKL